MAGVGNDKGPIGSFCRVFGVLAVAALIMFSGCGKPLSTTTSSIAVATSAAPTTSEAATSTATTTVTKSTAPRPATSTGPYGNLRMALSSFAGEDFYPPTSQQGALVANLAPMFDFLITLRGKDLAPGVLDKWEMAPDALSWTYRVRPGIKFHNGDELTARDVKFTLEQYAAPDAVSSELRINFDHVDLIDNYTVRVYTKGPQLDFPAYSTFASPSRGLVMPKDYTERNGVKNYRLHPVGSGPFKFVRWDPGNEIAYEAVENHWRATPAFRTLSLFLIPEQATRVAMLKTQGVDVIEGDTDAATALKAAGYRTFFTQSFSAMVPLYGAYLPAAAKMPISDMQVRQALSLAINRTEIVQNFFGGNASLPGPVLLSEVTRDIDWAYWSDYANKVTNRYDPAAAAKLITEAGYPQGFNIDLWTFTMTNGTYLPELAAVIQGYWAKIGVKAQIVPTDWGSFSATWNTLKNPKLIGQASVFRHDAGPFSYKNFDNHLDSRGLVALFGKTKPELDSLLDKIRFEIDPERKRTLIDQSIKMVVDTYVDLMVARVPAQGIMGPLVDIAYPQPTSYSITLYADIAKHR